MQPKLFVMLLLLPYVPTDICVVRDTHERHHGLTPPYSAKILPLVFPWQVVVVSDKGGSRWEQGANRVVEVTPELLEAPLDCVVDFWLEFEKTDASRAKVLVYPESVKGALQHWPGQDFSRF